ncbi:hypothetical protein [Paracoccus mutanolyticus]|uniref:hypothetical protein n=1 Tax=Paracoccus mutanolyticus TaxID=1499308 RepID=UPI0011AE273F|nr:hypothetical protein [Paracoccus mutanolyticus]
MQDPRSGLDGYIDHMTSAHPSPASQTKPIWFDAIGKTDAQLQSILNEMYVAYDHGANILTAVGLRTALDRATEVIGIDPAMTFEEKLTELKNGTKKLNRPSLSFS